MGIISLDPAVQVILLPVIIFALSFHEFSHGWIAYRLGDPTAFYAGRLTMNPMAHLDIFGSIAIYLMGFGWAKPVPVDPRHLSNPRRDMMWIALAGPASNFILALVSGLLLSLLLNFGIITSQSIFTIVLIMNLQINLALGLFNFLPIPPLDGSRILSGILPDQYQQSLTKLEYYGPRVLLGVILLGVVTGVSIIGIIITPLIRFFADLFTPGLFW
jgi:Zn-dependent protease